jgi:negative regulator of sigma E activity
MRIKEIEAKIAKLEASQRFSGLGRLSDAELDRQIVLGLNEMAADWPSFGAMVSALRESPMPADTDLAVQIEAFITDWQAQQRKKAAPKVAEPAETVSDKPKRAAGRPRKAKQAAEA